MWRCKNDVITIHPKHWQVPLKMGRWSESIISKEHTPFLLVVIIPQTRKYIPSFSTNCRCDRKKTGWFICLFVSQNKTKVKKPTPYISFYMVKDTQSRWIPWFNFYTPFHTYSSFTTTTKRSKKNQRIGLGYRNMLVCSITLWRKKTCLHKNIPPR
jgi:hypothetical protein